MRKLIVAAAAIAALAFLSACAGTPVDQTLAAASNVTVSASGTAQVQAGTGQAATGLGASLENALGADVGPDLAQAYNMAASATPVDTLGKACWLDWINLAAAMKSGPVPALTDASGNPIKLGSLHIATDVEQLRIGLAKAGITPLKIQTLTDCVAMIQDMKSKALAIPGGLTTIMTALTAGLVAEGYGQSGWSPT